MSTVCESTIRGCLDFAWSILWGQGLIDVDDASLHLCSIINTQED